MLAKSDCCAVFVGAADELPQESDSLLVDQDAGSVAGAAVPAVPAVLAEL